MKNLAKKLKDPTQHHSIASAVQLYDAQERKKMILQISETHLLLAANILKNCAQDHDLIAQVSAKAIEKAKQAQMQKTVALDALLCLIALKKYIAAADLMFIKNKKAENLKNNNIETLKNSESESVNADIMSIFIAISPNYQIALQFFEAMPSLAIQPNLACYDNLISKSPDYATRLNWYTQILGEGLKPVVEVYINLIAKSPDYPTALNWHKQILAEGLTQDVRAFEHLVYQSPDYATALIWYHQLLAEGLRATINVYNNLIYESPDYATALFWYDQILAEELSPNSYVYHNMIFKVQDLPDPQQCNQVAKRYYEKALQEGIRFDNINTYKYMIDFSLSYQEAFHYFSVMQNTGIQADEEVFEILQTKVKTQSEKRQFKALDISTK